MNPFKAKWGKRLNLVLHCLPLPVNDFAHFVCKPKMMAANADQDYWDIFTLDKRGCACILIGWLFPKMFDKLDSMNCI